MDVTSLGNFLKPEQLGHLLGVSCRTLGRWHRLRKGPPRVKIGRSVLYRQTAVLAWLSTRETDPSI